MTARDPQKCCEAVWSAILATAWPLVGIDSIGYMGDGFYRSKDPTNSIKVLKKMLQRKKTKNENN